MWQQQKIEKNDRKDAKKREREIIFRQTKVISRYNVKLILIKTK